MSQEAGVNPFYFFARRLVELHDQEGFPLELSLEMASEQKLSVPLLGILVEAVQRGWSKKLVKESVVKWAKCNTPTTSESLAFKCFGVSSMIGSNYGS